MKNLSTGFSINNIFKLRKLLVFRLHIIKCTYKIYVIIENSCGMGKSPMGTKDSARTTLQTIANWF
jgi:hypothetical protein